MTAKNGRGGRREWLALMAKAPLAGEVKTRLHEALRPEGAAALYRCFLLDTLAAMRRVREARPSVSLALAAAGLRRSAHVFEGFDLDGVFTIAQMGATLGQRLEACVDMLFGAGGALADAVVVIGADSPSLPVEHVRRAFELLEESGPRRVVLGPAADGGYYLIGVSAPHAELFEGISWSTSEVLAETLRAAAGAGLEVELLPVWYDVDTPEELERLRGDLEAEPSVAPATARHLLGAGH